MESNSERVLSSTETFIRAISLSTHSPFWKSMTFMTLMSLLSCFMICSRICSFPLVTIVILDTDGSKVSATLRDSILKPLPLKSPETLERTPNSFSTRTDIVCRIYIFSLYQQHLAKRLTRRDHGEYAFLRVDLEVHEH